MVLDLSIIILNVCFIIWVHPTLPHGEIILIFSPFSFIVGWVMPGKDETPGMTTGLCVFCGLEVEGEGLIIDRINHRYNHIGLVFFDSRYQRL